MVFPSFYWLYCHIWGFVYGVISYVEILEEKCCAVQTVYFHQLFIFYILHVFMLFLVKADHAFLPFYHFFSNDKDVFPMRGTKEGHFP